MTAQEIIQIGRDAMADSFLIGHQWGLCEAYFGCPYMRLRTVARAGGVALSIIEPEAVPQEKGLETDFI